jgi:hypothetical protein
MGWKVLRMFAWSSSLSPSLYKLKIRVSLNLPFLRHWVVPVGWAVLIGSVVGAVPLWMRLRRKRRVVQSEDGRGPSHDSCEYRPFGNCTSMLSAWLTEFSDGIDKVFATHPPQMHTNIVVDEAAPRKIRTGKRGTYKHDKITQTRAEKAEKRLKKAKEEERTYAATDHRESRAITHKSGPSRRNRPRNSSVTSTIPHVPSVVLHYHYHQQVNIPQYSPRQQEHGLQPSEAAYRWGSSLLQPQVFASDAGWNPRYHDGAGHGRYMPYALATQQSLTHQSVVPVISDAKFASHSSRGPEQVANHNFNASLNAGTQRSVLPVVAVGSLQPPSESYRHSTPDQAHLLGLFVLPEGAAETSSPPSGDTSGDHVEAEERGGGATNEFDQPSESQMDEIASDDFEPRITRSKTFPTAGGSSKGVSPTLSPLMVSADPVQ